MTLQSVVERLVGALKRDASYRITGTYTLSQLGIVLWHRGWQWLRGVPLRVRAPGVRGLVLRGRRVVIEHAGQLSANAGLILEDGVFMNALSVHGIALGHNVTVARGASLTCTGVLAHIGEGIRIGNRSAVGAGSFLAGQGGIDIGDDVLMGPGVRILSENHTTRDATVPMRVQGVERRGVRIGNDCWLGAGVTVVDGVTIGMGTVIGAGAVVTSDIPPYSVAVGVPARVIRSRQRGPAAPDLATPHPASASAATPSAKPSHVQASHASAPDAIVHPAAR